MTETNSRAPIFDGPQIRDPGVEMDQCGCCVRGRPRPEPQSTVQSITYVMASVSEPRLDAPAADR